jgi:hypothetical protein
MKIIHYLDAIFIKLSIIPGLGFLHEYVEELEIQQQRRRLLTQQYRGYAGALREAGDAAQHGGHGHGGHEDHGKHEEHGGHGKPAKRGKKSAPPAARPGRGGQVARASQGKEEDPDDLEPDYYEDDDFESYLQH